MPIVNGTYVNDSLPGSKAAQQQVFGEHSSRDMSDYSAAAYNYLMKQQEQAYNLELWNLQNEYNSPASQMKRFQDAGLNPNLIYGQQNTAQAPQAASATGFRSGNVQARRMQNAISTIGQVMNVIKSARDTYDYMKYGADEHAWQRNLLIQKGQGQALENMWNQYLLGLTEPGTSEEIANSPRGRMYKYQTDTQYQRYEQLRAICAALPDQQARTRSLKALDDYRLQILQGQYGAIMNINSGNGTIDAFLRMLGFYLLGK